MKLVHRALVAVLALLWALPSESSAQIFLASKPHPDFAVGPLFVIANVRPDLSVTVNISFSLPLRPVAAHATMGPDRLSLQRVVLDLLRYPLPPGLLRPRVVPGYGDLSRLGSSPYRRGGAGRGHPSPEPDQGGQRGRGPCPHPRGRHRAAEHEGAVQLLCRPDRLAPHPRVARAPPAHQHRGHHHVRPRAARRRPRTPPRAAV